MKKRMDSKTICGRLLCLFVMPLFLSACGKKEQTGAGADGQQEHVEAQGQAAGGIDEDVSFLETQPEASARDERNAGGGAGQDEPGSGHGALQDGQGVEADDARDVQGTEESGAQERENEAVRNEQGPENENSQDGQRPEPENGQGGNTDAERAQDGKNADAGSVQNGQNGAAAPQVDGSGNTPYGAHGALSVSGTQLVDAYGAPYQLRGVSTHGLSWFPQYANRDAFRTMRDEWGVNVVRLAMYTAESGGYCVGDENNRSSLRQLVYDSVDAATELGMYVIVDWHVLNDRDPNTYIDQAIAFFRETAERYAGNGNVIYEICNEPNGGVSWQRIKAYAEQVIPVIREQDADAVILVGTPTWSQDVDQAAANPITGYENIMYTLHFYADTHRDSLRQKMVNAIGAGLPVFVSEFGICDASGNGAINAAEADKWISTMDENGVSYCVWNLSNKAETSALLRTSTTATSGWSYDELSESGKWFVDMMGADHAVIGGTAGSENGNGGNGSASDSGSGAASNGGSNNGGSGNGGNGAASGSGGGTSGSGNGGNESASGSGSAQSVTSDASGSLQASVSLSNSWETDGKHYYQYSLELANPSGAKVNGWTCEISFDHNMSVSQSWCGGFSVSGSSLTITPESYNAAIEAGAVQGNIGFILEADTALTVTGVSCR